MASRSRIPNVKVDDLKVEQILRAIKSLLDNYSSVNDIEVLSSTSGIILRDEEGNRWRVTIDSSGTLVQTQL